MRDDQQNGAPTEEQAADIRQTIDQLNALAERGQIRQLIVLAQVEDSVQDEKDRFRGAVFLRPTDSAEMVSQLGLLLQTAAETSDALAVKRAIEALASRVTPEEIAAGAPSS